MNKIKQKAQKMARGGRNLTILGVASIIIATMTTGVSLAIYHNSGDIYLDRSRPGFLPDEEEVGEEEEKIEEEYDYAKNGELTKAGLEEYLRNLENEVKAVESYENPFGAEMLSDEHLGITDGANPDGDEGESAKELESEGGGAK